MCCHFDYHDIAIFLFMELLFHLAIPIRFKHSNAASSNMPRETYKIFPSKENMQA